MPTAIHYTYSTISHRIESIHLTQQSAIAAAATSAIREAGPAAGASMVQDAEGRMVDAIHMEPMGSWYHYPTNPTVRQAPRVRYILRAAHQARHDLLEGLTRILEGRDPRYGRISQFFSSSDISKGHDLIYRLHQIGYLVGTKAVAVGGGTTARHQLAWIQAAARGPTDAEFDIANPLTYFDIAHTIPAPMGPFSIVDITTLARRTLGTAVTEVVAVGGVGQPAEPTSALLRGGAWIASINE